VTSPVSVVVPSLGDTELLERNLPALLAEFDARGVGDELVVVDDTGDGVLEPWLAGRFPAARVVSRSENGGFARALLDGVRDARRDLVFSMNPDVRVRAGFLGPLVEALEEPDVAAAVPEVLLGGEEGRIESLVELVFERGFVELNQPALGQEAGERGGPSRRRPVAFAVGGTALLRREPFLAAGGFDPLFEPFYWEDVDYGWCAWRKGQRVVFEPRSVVEHHHRGTIGKVVPPDVVRAAIEKNRLLFQWKHLDGELLAAHLVALNRRAIDAWLCDERDELLWIHLALEQLEEALASRARAAQAAESEGGRASFRDLAVRTSERADG